MPFRVRVSQKIAIMVIVGLQLARLLAVKLVEQELSRRAKEPTEWSGCPECGTRLGSKGQKPRQLDTIIGKISWSRRIGRCPNKCRIGQVVPLDQELALLPNQIAKHPVGNLPKLEASRLLACRTLKGIIIFIPYESAAILLSMLTGITVSSSSIHNWVQIAGQLMTLT